MKRTMSLDEREDLIQELAGEHFHNLRAKLQGGNAELVSTIDEAAFASLPDSFWREIVILAANGFSLSVGTLFVKKVEDALLAQAEIEAIKEVEQIEREAA